MATLSTDDFRRLYDRARDRVEHARTSVAERVTQPDQERNDLAEYTALTDSEHATLYKEVGADQYQAYVDEMERLKVKHSGG
jgi:hypothetical protein